MGDAPQVRLRPVVANDRDRLRAWRNQPDVRRWMYSDHEISESEHHAWFDRLIAESRPRHWIIEADGAPIGLVNLYDLHPAHERGSWAYYLADAAVRGKGVGAAVEYLTLETAFGAFGLHKLWCEVLIDNELVVRLHESFGFRREALLRDHVCKAGRWTDVVGLGLLAADWRDRREESRLRLVAKGFEL